MSIPSSDGSGSLKSVIDSDHRTIDGNSCEFTRFSVPTMGAQGSYGVELRVAHPLYKRKPGLVFDYRSDTHLNGHPRQSLLKSLLLVSRSRSQHASTIRTSTRTVPSVWTSCVRNGPQRSLYRRYYSFFVALSDLRRLPRRIPGALNLKHSFSAEA